MDAKGCSQLTLIHLIYSNKIVFH